ncbi:hypothetical protein [Thalassospira sp. TSL5-1]|uniref:hypothetical protein n=1 Tax=Thalassospira sp. TSL5-1 TaxID=1544451 RepID=UPI00093E1EA8|nr:hypothetical protein [Thalassospira sp. TSL5-1]OKH86847.1 hypothetical protein LF95_20845 [Thalassospira sp. TSL5-1]
MVVDLYGITSPQIQRVIHFIHSSLSGRLIIFKIIHLWGDEIGLSGFDSFSAGAALACRSGFALPEGFNDMTAGHFVSVMPFQPL